MENVISFMTYFNKRQALFKYLFTLTYCLHNNEEEDIFLRAYGLTNNKRLAKFISLSRAWQLTIHMVNYEK